MPEPVIATPPAASTETVEPPKAVTVEDVQRIIEASLSGFTSKVNGELAGFRRSMKGGTPATDAAPPAPVTVEDLTASREVGRLEAQLGQQAIEALGEDYAAMSIREQARTLRMLAKLPRGETPATTTSRGETPAKTPTTSRAEPPLPRDSVPRPTTRREFHALKPEQRQALLRDEGFDPTKLPL